MLEVEDVLQTWALGREPVVGIPIEAEKLADHRKRYLDYEGPVSGGRGTVTRWTFGDYSMIQNEDDQMVVHLQTGRFVGAVSLSRKPDQRWMITFSKASTASV